MYKFLNALGSEKRRLVFGWLKEPKAHFPPQMHGDLVSDGVCVVFIAEKLGVSQPTATEHMQVLRNAGLVTATRKKQWTYYRRDERGIERARLAFGDLLDIERLELETNG